MAVGYLDDKRTAAVKLDIINAFGAERGAFLRHQHNRVFLVSHSPVERLVHLVLGVNDDSLDARDTHSHLRIGVVANQKKLHIRLLKSAEQDKDRNKQAVNCNALAERNENQRL